MEKIDQRQRGSRSQDYEVGRRNLDVGGAGSGQWGGAWRRCSRKKEKDEMGGV